VSEERNPQEPEGDIEDLDVPAELSEDVKGGEQAPARKAGKGQQEFLVVKMNDVIITGY
jgi:hypothetical protein